MSRLWHPMTSPRTEHDADRAASRHLSIGAVLLGVIAVANVFSALAMLLSQP